MQAHGGQVSPLTHAGQAQPQPAEPEPVPVPVVICWQTPDRHGPLTGQATPSAIQTQASPVSALQLWASAYDEQGSLGGVVEPPAPPVPVPGELVPVPAAGTVVVGTEVDVPEPLPPTVTGPPFGQLQSQAGQVSPGAHTGHAQAQVPPPVPVEQPPLPPVQSQLQGRHASPGAQAGQAQVQVPPPVLPLPPSVVGGGGGQSQATAGQSALGGQATGCAQAQPPPEASAAWQKPLPPQAYPAGHSRPSAGDHAQRASAAQAAASEIWLQGSGATQTPEGQAVSAGQATPSATHEQPFCVSARQASALAWGEQPVTSAAGICDPPAGAGDVAPQAPPPRAAAASIVAASDQKARGRESSDRIIGWPPR